MLCALSAHYCVAQKDAPAVTRQLKHVAQIEHTGPFLPNWTSLGKYEAPSWYRDAKFGIFLHWGVYSVPAFANEWYSRNMYQPDNGAYKHHIETYGPQSSFGYKDFIPRFTGEHFNADEWVQLFSQAGARYIVPVAEHCDGFAMYNSSVSEWNAAKMGPHRDVVGELAAATRKHGLRFGVSSHRAEHWWWYNGGTQFNSDVNDARYAGLYGPAKPMALPDDDQIKEPNPDHLERWLPPDGAFLNDWLARSTELVDKYSPDFFYFDWWVGQPAFQPYLQRFATFYYNHAATRRDGVVLTYKQHDFPENAAVLDIERAKLDGIRLLPWQTDTSISVHSWGFVQNDTYRSADSLIAELVDVVSKNGNLLLNVGPKADGIIPGEARIVLQQIGAWLRINGEAVYGSRPWLVYGEGPTRVTTGAMGSDGQAYTAADVRYTTNHGSLYAFALGWPEKNELRLQALGSATAAYLPGHVCSIQLLGSKDKITWDQKNDGLHIHLPSTKPSESTFVFRIQTSIAPGSTCGSAPILPVE
jgi:alpha-L-fucosidase